MSRQPFRDRVIALAGIFQATDLVRQAAREGTVAAEPYAASMFSVFQTDAQSVAAVFDGLSGVQRGLEVLGRQLGSAGAGRDLEVTRYSVGVLALERKLRRHPDMLAQIRDGIEQALPRAEATSVVDAEAVAMLAKTYQQTVSTLGPRLMVSGDPAHLSDEADTARIRALLLAAIRSAVLWRQLGGTQFQVLFSRARILDTQRALLAEIEALDEEQA